MRNASSQVEAPKIDPLKGEPPSIVVLPFRLVGEGEGYAGVADGLPAEITSSLSRLRWLRVISRASAHRFRSIETPLDVVRTELDVGYAVSGQIEVQGRGIALDVELAETRGGTILWAERYEIAPDELHAVRSRIVGQLLSTLELDISRNEVAGMRISNPQDLTAWQNFHLGQVEIYTTVNRDFPFAEACFGRAVELAPDFGRAHAGLAITHFWQAMNRSDEQKAHYDRMSRSIDRALDLDAEDPLVLVSAGQIRGFQGTAADGVPLLASAIDRAPGLARAYGTLGPMQAIIGSAEEGLANCDKAIWLSPLDPLMSNLQIGRAASLYRLGRNEDAASSARHLLVEPNNTMLANLVALAVFDSVEDRESAEKVVIRIKEQAGRIDSSYIQGLIPTADQQLISGIFKSLMDRQLQLG